MGSRIPPAAPFRAGASGAARGRRRQPEPQKSRPGARPAAAARREGRPVLTVHSSASGSFTCSGDARTETRQPPARPGPRSAGGNRRGAERGRLQPPTGQPPTGQPRPHLHGGRQPKESGHEEVAEAPQPPRRPPVRHGRGRDRHRLRGAGPRGHRRYPVPPLANSPHPARAGPPRDAQRISFVVTDFLEKTGRWLVLQIEPQSSRAVLLTGFTFQLLWESKGSPVFHRLYHQT